MGSEGGNGCGCALFFAFVELAVIVKVVPVVEKRVAEVALRPCRSVGEIGRRRRDGHRPRALIGADKAPLQVGPPARRR